LPGKLQGLANIHRYNGLWTRDVQNAIFAILFCGWLGGMGTSSITAESGKLLTIEEVGTVLSGTCNYTSTKISNSSQFPSISRIGMLSISPSKNISNP
jgi:hypothetical protein